MKDPQLPWQQDAAERRRRTVMARLGRLGLAEDRTATLAGPVNPKLLELARERAGVATDSQLTELALSNLVLDDEFSEAFRAVKGTVDAGIDLES